MKAVLISIQPKWCELIASGKKTIEVRKSKPKLETPFKAYIYMTAGDASCPVTINGAPYTCHNNGGKCVIGEFICDTFITDKTFGHDALFNAAACMSVSEAMNYSAGKEIYGWHISDLTIYDRAKKLRDFRKICKYRNEDGSCQYRKIGCDRAKFDFNPDGSVNLADCLDHMARPPQSWCYVEELCI